MIINLKTWRRISTEDAPPVVLCLGNFDGVHRGHAALIKATVEKAQALRDEIPGVCAGAWCFARPPRRYVADEQVPQITSLREKLVLMAELGLDYVYLADFAVLRNMAPEQFIHDVLQNTCRCVSTVCGFNHRFGRGGAGQPSDLSIIFGDRAQVLSPVNDLHQGVVISSSRIRTLLTDGNMTEAVDLLGHPFVLTAPVMHGKALGRTIGTPTINQNFPAGHIIPAYGIYATRVRIGECHYIGVTNVGCRPTVEDSARVNCETYILDYNGSLYGELITTEFYAKLRDERKFSDLAELTTAICADANAARAYFGQEGIQ